MNAPGALAKKYQVSKTAIQQIAEGKTYAE